MFWLRTKKIIFLLHTLTKGLWLPLFLPQNFTLLGIIRKLLFHGHFPIIPLKNCHLKFYSVKTHSIPKDPKHSISKDPKHSIPKDPKHSIPKNPKHYIPKDPKRSVIKGTTLYK